jgi:hypothetical protein
VHLSSPRFSPASDGEGDEPPAPALPADGDEEEEVAGKSAAATAVAGEVAGSAVAEDDDEDVMALRAELEALDPSAEPRRPVGPERQLSSISEASEPQLSPRADEGKLRRTLTTPGSKSRGKVSFHLGEEETDTDTSMDTSLETSVEAGRDGDSDSPSPEKPDKPSGSASSSPAPVPVAAAQPNGTPVHGTHFTVSRPNKHVGDSKSSNGTGPSPSPRTGAAGSSAMNGIAGSAASGPGQEHSESPTLDGDRDSPLSPAPPPGEGPKLSRRTSAMLRLMNKKDKQRKARDRMQAAQKAGAAAAAAAAGGGPSAATGLSRSQSAPNSAPPAAHGHPHHGAGGKRHTVAYGPRPEGKGLLREPRHSMSDSEQFLHRMSEFEEKETEEYQELEEVEDNKLIYEMAMSGDFSHHANKLRDVSLVKHEILRHGRTLRNEHMLTRKLSEILSAKDFQAKRAFERHEMDKDAYQQVLKNLAEARDLIAKQTADEAPAGASGTVTIR